MDFGAPSNETNHILGVPKGEKKQKGADSLFKEIMVENSPNLWREMDIQVHEACRSTNRFNSKRTLLRHIILKLSKIRDGEDLKASRSNRHIQIIPPNSSRIYILAKSTQNILQDRSYVMSENKS